MNEFSDPLDKITEQDNKYSLLSAEIPFREEYRELGFIQELLKDPIYVSQSCAEISADKTLYSEGFSKCTAMILRDDAVTTGALFHIDNWFLSDYARAKLANFVNYHLSLLGLTNLDSQRFQASVNNIVRGDHPVGMSRDQFRKILVDLGLPQSLHARFIVGDNSRDMSDSMHEELLNPLAFTMKEKIKIHTDDRFSLVYPKPYTEFFVPIPLQRKILKFGF